MKRIDTDHSWNWVDQNNRMVGFENQTHCCEDFGYQWLDSCKKEIADCELFDNEPELNFTGKYQPYDIDVSYYGGNMGYIFQCELSDKIYYLYIYNEHNFYYCHGFEFKDGDEMIKEGEI